MLKPRRNGRDFQNCPLWYPELAGLKVVLDSRWLHLELTPRTSHRINDELLCAVNFKTHNKIHELGSCSNPLIQDLTYHDSKPYASPIRDHTEAFHTMDEVKQATLNKINCETH